LPLILDFMAFDLLLSTQCSAHAELFLSIFSSVRYDPPVLVLDLVQFDPSLSLQSSAHFGFSPSTYGLT